MSKVLIGTIISLLLAIFCWFGEMVTYPSNYETSLVLSAVCFSILSICLLCVSIVKRISKNASSYLVFAITDIVIGTIAFLYAVYDIITTEDSEFFPRLTGWLLLFFAIPSVLFLLFIDYVVYRKSKKNQSREN